MKLEGAVWRFNGSGDSRLTAIGNALAEAGIRGKANGWTHRQLAEAMIGPSPSEPDAFANWEVQAVRQTGSLRDLRSKQSRKAARYGGEGPGKKRDTLQWLWFLPLLADG
jgi:hypothetical protein